MIFTKYYSVDKTKKNEMGKTFGTYGRQQNCIQSFGGKPEGKRPLGRPRRRREYDIKIYLQEVEWVAWAGLIWLRMGTGGGHL